MFVLISDMAYQPPFPPPLGAPRQANGNSSQLPSVPNAMNSRPPHMNYPNLSTYSQLPPASQQELSRNSSAPNVAPPLYQNSSANYQQSTLNSSFNGKSSSQSTFNGPSKLAPPSSAFTNGPSEPRHGPQGQFMSRSVSSPPGSGPIAAHQVQTGVPPLIHVSIDCEQFFTVFLASHCNSIP